MDSENVLNRTNFVILLWFHKDSSDFHRNSKKKVERVCRWNLEVKIRGNGGFRMIPDTC